MITNFGFWKAAGGTPPAPNNNYEFTIDTGVATVFTMDYGGATYDATVAGGDLNEVDGDTVAPFTVSGAKSYNQDCDLTFDAAGVKDIVISPTGAANTGWPYINKSTDASMIKKVTNLGKLGYTRFYETWQGAPLTEFTAGTCDTSAVTDCTRNFKGITTIDSNANFDISTCDFSSLTTATSMFEGMTGAGGLTSLDLTALGSTGVGGAAPLVLCANILTSNTVAAIDVSGWDMTAVTSMNNALQYASGTLTGVDGWRFGASCTFVQLSYNSYNSSWSPDLWAAKPSSLNLAFGINTGRTAFPDLSGWDFSVLTNCVSVAYQTSTLATYPAGSLQGATTNPCTNYATAFTNCGLPSAEVNKVYADLVANGASNGTFGIGGGTNQAPTDQGITDRTTLVAAGWTCTDASGTYT